MGEEGPNFLSFPAGVNRALLLPEACGSWRSWRSSVFNGQASLSESRLAGSHAKVPCSLAWPGVARGPGEAISKSHRLFLAFLHVRHSVGRCFLWQRHNGRRENAPPCFLIGCAGLLLCRHKCHRSNLWFGCFSLRLQNSDQPLPATPTLALAQIGSDQTDDPGI